MKNKKALLMIMILSLLTQPFAWAEATEFASANK